MEPPKQDSRMSLHQVDDDEQVLAVIKRHPFGIIKLYFQSFIGLLAAGGLIMYILPELVSRDENPQIYSLVALISVIILGFMAFVLFVVTIIYYKSKLVVTDKTITQTIQNGLFNQKVSQLAVTSIEDVTADKNGVFPTLLDYGKLLIETAGEQENFHFEFCPKADHYAKLILETRQQYLTSKEFEMGMNRVPLPTNMATSQSQYDVPQTPPPATPGAWTPPQPQASSQQTPPPTSDNTAPQQLPPDQPPT